MNKKLSALLFLLFALSNISCSVYQTLVNVSRLQFKLGTVNNLEINSVAVQGKNSLKDFSAIDIFKLSSAVARKSFPVSFTLNVDAKNPNDGTGGYAKTNLTLSHFNWRLFIDDKETVSGDLEQPMIVPGTGETTIIPIQVNIDLVKFFGNRGLESLINLALSISGNRGSSSNIALYVRPTVSSPLGDIQYPQEIKIISKQFTN